MDQTMRRRSSAVFSSLLLHLWTYGDSDIEIHASFRNLLISMWSRNLGTLRDDWFFSFFFFFLLNRVRGNIALDWKFCSWHSHCWMDLLLNVLWLELLVYFFLYFHSTIVCCVESVSCLLLFQSLLLQTRYLIVRPVLSKFDLWHRILEPCWYSGLEFRIGIGSP